MKTPSPIERMIDAACMKCAKCGAAMGTCDCWVLCDCGRSFERGGECPNPEHTMRAAADTLASSLAQEVLDDMAEGYRMFQGDRAIPERLRRRIVKRASDMIVDVFKGLHDAKMEHEHKVKR